MIEVHGVKNRILELLEEKQMTQYQLAKKSELSPSTLSAMLNRDTKPSYETVIKLCKGFGVPFSYFAKEYEDEIDYESFDEDRKRKLLNDAIINMGFDQIDIHLFKELIKYFKEKNQKNEIEDEEK